jgi:DNA repair protein RadC
LRVQIRAVDSVRPTRRGIRARASPADASELLVAHNQPSGAAEPGESDRLLTKDLLAAAPIPTARSRP